jgi:pSer/pThr/pTyr-binding forkhead associated (FHA) protein
VVDVGHEILARATPVHLRARQLRSPVRRLVLEVLEGEDAGRQVQLNWPIEVGREAGLGLALEDGAVCARHARFAIEYEEAVVEDLGSASGTYVNEAR